MTSTQQPGEQVLVIDGVAPERRKLDLAGCAVLPRFGEECLDHSCTVGLLSYTVKDYNPIAHRGTLQDNSPMVSRDPFVEGLRAVLEARPDLTPAGLSVAAGLDNSTLRKLLAGTINSLTVEKAERVAKEAGLDLSAVIALGERSDGADIVRLAMAIQQADPEERARIDAYLQVAQSAKPTAAE